MLLPVRMDLILQWYNGKFLSDIRYISERSSRSHFFSKFCRQQVLLTNFLLFLFGDFLFCSDVLWDFLFCSVCVLSCKTLK